MRSSLLFFRRQSTPLFDVRPAGFPVEGKGRWQLRIQRVGARPPLLISRSSLPSQGNLERNAIAQVGRCAGGDDLQ